jgi:hypothetical protein
MIIMVSRFVRTAPARFAAAFATVGLAAALAAASALLTVPSEAAVLEENFADDPFVDHGDGSPVFERRGPIGAFTYEPASPALFEGDAPGSLAVLYDTLEPTARALTPLPAPLGAGDDFRVSAVLVIRSEDFHADPDGFAQISFGLMNRATTGDDRTGDLADSRADTFDTLEFDYFPNVSPFFGGPFTGGAVFGGAAVDDAFANFAFATASLALPLDEPVEAVLEHRSGEAKVEIRMYTILPDGARLPLHEAPVVIGTGALEPGFTLDALGVFAYHDGFNVFTGSGRSLRATVDYHRLAVEFDAAIPVEAQILPDPLFVSTRNRFVRARLAPLDPVDATRLAALAGGSPDVELWLGAIRLAAALRAAYDPDSGVLTALFGAAEVLAGLGSARGDLEIQVRGAVEGADSVFILGRASGSGDNPGRRRAF